MAKEVSPYLEGHLNPDSEYPIKLEVDFSPQLDELYHSIAGETPEAGAAYWMTRTWDLLAWQPIYVAFISIYALKTKPVFSDMSQKICGNFVAGFEFSTTKHTQDEVPALITSSGKELIELFEHYRNTMNKCIRIRPGFVKHLLADLVLSCIIKLQHYSPALTHQYLLGQAQLWFKALELPQRPISGLYVNSETGKTELIRTSCCLVYKCKEGNLCTDCPRRKNDGSLR
ncbi:siderophore ferric iron reductase [Vibrio sp. WXL210]|uniref:siderophore ferric iron reductase n=1 Tax=Vibrio sp. WXL210 TaxID=3450709 RepID=UPI003EC524A8